MNFKTQWKLGGYLPNGKVRVFRFDGGILQEKVILVDAMPNLNRPNKYQVKGIDY